VIPGSSCCIHCAYFLVVAFHLVESKTPIFTGQVPWGRKKKKTGDQKTVDDNEKRKTDDDRLVHQLYTGFTFWYLLKKDSKPGFQGYEKAIKKLVTFRTVEDFWACYSHMVRPNELTNGVTYHLFRDGVVPAWEDPANREGGKWVVRLKKGVASRVWEELILLVIGDGFMLGEEVCGAVIASKFSEDALSVWNKTANNYNIRFSIRDTLKRVLNISMNQAFEYKPHDQALKNTRST